MIQISNLMSKGDVRLLLEFKITQAGGIRKWCSQMGIHPSVADHFLKRRRGPSPQLLKAMNVQRITVFKERRNLP